uniref:Uncharacterized protein n=2 Tax=Mucochytrium quahogii TaxID=96639 RepID=A0A7S2S0E4_9STRA|mmetsp:Transcript_6210/g.9786  ORF Transcript_6210/g.9786 Transcript_6210/m.9786 type:complete len:291 (+) Transcript_6210:438-1310(+)
MVLLTYVTPKIYNGTSKLNGTTVSLVLVAAGVASYLRIRKSHYVPLISELHKLGCSFFVTAQNSFTQIVLLGQYAKDMFGEYLGYSTKSNNLDDAPLEEKVEEESVSPMLEQASTALDESLPKCVEDIRSDTPAPMAELSPIDTEKDSSQVPENTLVSPRSMSPFLNLVEKIPGISQTWTFISSLEFESKPSGSELLEDEIDSTVRLDEIDPIALEEEELEIEDFQDGYVSNGESSDYVSKDTEEDCEDKENSTSNVIYPKSPGSWFNPFSYNECSERSPTPAVGAGLQQ